MPNAKDAEAQAYHRILLVGPTGSGKSSQAFTLPGKKFAYIFDPNSMATLRGCDLEYERFMPDVMSMDMSLKGFNIDPSTKKPFKGDKPTGKLEPRLWLSWGDHFNAKYAEGFFKQFDWLIFDSLTFISKCIMDRQLYINNRYGDLEERADYRIVGNKMADVFGTINTMDINILCTGHIDTYEDEDTKRIRTQLMLPGRARKMLPLQFTDIFLSHVVETADKKGVRYQIRTVPDPRGLQDIRTSMSGLSPEEDVTIGDGKTAPRDVPNPEKWGIGKLIGRNMRQKLAVVR